MKTIVHVFYGPWDTAVCKGKKAHIKQILQNLRRSDLLIYDDVRYGRYKFPFEEGDTTLNALLQEFEKNNLSVRIDRLYTAQELLAAELLHLMITGTVGEGRDHYGTQFDRSQACRGCWTGLIQLNDLIIDKTKMGKKDIAMTYTGEIVISERLARLIQNAQLKGYEMRPVRHHSNRLRDEPVLYQLLVTHTLPPVAPLTQVYPCSICGRSTLAAFTEIYYLRQDLEQRGVKDFNQTLEPPQELIISQRAYHLFLEYKIKGFNVEIVRVLG